MTENFRFVSTLGTELEFTPGSHEVAPGSHADCIIKESLRQEGEYDNVPQGVDSFCSLLTSFPDILPEPGQALLSRAGSIFTRGEFLALRAVGDRVVELPLAGEGEERFAQIVDAVAAAAPPVVYHRLMDYNPSEFGFLANQPHDYDSLRGSGRLLADERLLHHELGVVERLRRAGKAVRVVLPFVSSPGEQERLQEAVFDAGADEIGVMVERIEHAERIEEYPSIDFAVPGPADLTVDLMGAQRSDFRESGNGVQQKVTDIVQGLANKLASHPDHPYFIAVKYLIDSVCNPGSPDFKRAAYMPHQLLIHRERHELAGLKNA